MEERRRFVRVPGNLRLSYKIIPNVKIGESITKNISEGGLRFFVNEFIPKNNFLKIRMTLGKKCFSFEILTRVAWIREDSLFARHEIGVEFINMPKETTEALVDFIKNLSSYE